MELVLNKEKRQLVPNLLDLEDGWDGARSDVKMGRKQKINYTAATWMDYGCVSKSKRATPQALIMPSVQAKSCLLKNECLQMNFENHLLKLMTRCFPGLWLHWENWTDFYSIVLRHVFNTGSVWKPHSILKPRYITSHGLRCWLLGVFLHAMFVFF